MGRPKTEAASPVDRASHHLVARLFLDGNGFSRKHRLVYPGRPLLHDAVCGQAFAGPHKHQIADREFSDRDIHLLVSLGDAGQRRTEGKQRPHGVPGPLPGARFQIFAQQNERNDRRRGFEVRMGGAGGQRAGPEQGHHRISVGRAGPQHDQRVHVRA